MLELAERLKNTPTEYGIRFVATSGEEEGKLGAENLLKRMSDTEKKNTLLVINLDNLIVGDKLYFNSGVKTPEAVRKLTRDRALAIARSHGIAATTNPGLNKNYPKGTGCCNDAEIFDKAGIAVLSVEATNWNLGNKDGYQQRAKTRRRLDGLENGSWVFYRRGGEFSVISIIASSAPGLSPLARGTPASGVKSHRRCRFIPAGAGNSRFRRCKPGYRAVYPR